jgi:hypothetical protein
MLRTLIILLFIVVSAEAFAVVDSVKKVHDDKPSGGGFSIGGGVVYGLPISNLSSVINSNIGFQFQVAWLKKRFAFEGCVSGFSSDSKRDIVIASQNIPTNSTLDFYTVGIQASYSVIYTETWRVNPLTGPGWSSLTLKNSKDPNNQFTWVAGVKTLYNLRGRTNLGGLKDGLVFPFYFKYLYSFPIELTTDVTGGAHFFSLGLEFYFKSPDE